MRRRRYVLAYDIRDDVRLREVHKIAKSFGEPLQYSVFVCDLDGVEVVALRRALVVAMNQAVDSIVLIDLGRADGALQRFEFIGSRVPLPSHGARIL